MAELSIVGVAHSGDLAGPNGTTVTSVPPAGVVAGDLLVAAVLHREATAGAVTGPAGWTLLTSATNTAVTTQHLVVWTKVATGSEPADYTWTGAAATRKALVIHAARGAVVEASNGNGDHFSQTVTKAAGGDSILLGIVSCAIAGGPGTWTPSDSPTITAGGATTDRLVAFHRTVAAAGGYSVVAAHSATQHGGQGVAVLLSPP